MSDDFNPENVVARLRDLFKSDQPVGSATRKPPGPWGAKKAEAGPASLPGLAAPGNVPGPGRGNTSLGNASTLDAQTIPKQEAATLEAQTVPKQDAATIPKQEAATIPKGAGGASPKEFLYVSKKDFPQAPNGTVDSTPNSWKVPAGIGRQLKAKLGEAPEEPATTEDQAKGFSKQKNSVETIKAHLAEGKIAVKKRTEGDNVSETFKVVIQGNGAGLMKPEVKNYFLKNKEVEDQPGSGPGWKYDANIDKWTKVEVTPIDPYKDMFYGAGAGNLPFRKQPQREVAGYQVAQLHGMDNTPVTVGRLEEGVQHSVQEFKEGFKDIFDVIKEDSFLGNMREIDILRAFVSKDKKAELDQSLMDIAVHDIVINNNDRHMGNYLVNPNTGKIILIDHGLAFANGMHGNRNHFLHQVFHKNTPIKMSETLQKRLSNLSYGDYKRAKPGMQDWEAGQDFLRNRYVLWLQKEHGEIDRQKFLNTQGNNIKTYHAVGDEGDWNFVGGNLIDKQNEFTKREAAGVLPYQLFESWAKGYLEKAAGDPTHRDHEDAKALSELGVFMDRGYCSYPGGEAAYRAKGLHKAYEATIKANMDIPKDIPAYLKAPPPQVVAATAAVHNSGTFSP